MNKWYDSLPEPIRFLTFFVPVATLIIVIVSAPEPYNGIALLILAGLSISRMIYILTTGRGR